jgi:uncharacterized membrane protein
MTTTSIAGILFRNEIYPSEEIVNAFVPNDVVNLLVGLPTIIISLVLTRKEKLVGLLFWPGALLFIIYNYLIYVLAMPFSFAFLIHLILVIASVYDLIGLIENIDGKKVKQQLIGNIPERLTSGVLVGLGLLFLFQAIGVMILAFFNQTIIPGTELALHISDSILATALIIGGILLWKNKKFGYIAGLGLLFQVSTLFIGLIAFVIIQPFLTSLPFVLVDVIVISIMGLISFIPLGLFIRCIIKRK